MSRTTRTVLVLVFSLLVASAASLIVLRQVQSIPVREVEVGQLPGGGRGQEPAGRQPGHRPRT